MQLHTAARKRVKLRLNIASPSGFGKTYGALLLAYGITGNWQKIAVIDTENDSASLYAHLGNFETVSLKPPFSPDRYIQAIRMCEEAGMEVIIIDSVTHVWKGQGGLLEYQNSLGGRYQDWAKATPLYQQWLNAILQSPCHVITTCRKKQAYNIITEGNKTKVEKAGLDDEIRDGYEYEMTLALEITNDQHMARASKDRTGLFSGKPEFIITSETGKKILNWCNEGIHSTDPGKSGFSDRINACKDIGELGRLYILHPEYQQEYHDHFSRRKKELQPLAAIAHLSTQNTYANGSSNI
ncbi:AAA family ATPase [Pseudobacter ginsenosidimutans]|uniref:Signal recognition particle subunit FFH/SRP54 (Srp54) n=1 Tax=Pseudobacter ginsenosidimutans TaxID=661488 RepID=A0A4Q7N4E5_9BACT|nr:AAA family ATPase [Pseudobacter ginsenosidimutans]QEC44404.1 AAA family ATPase [Pseudobacter ginsenosidimutans]RZS75874.1 signal recognition particle subunit FFH/SRP54 (srp54) [Pseudobacter ginsenosidimutans]